MLPAGSKHKDVIKVNCHLELGDVVSQEIRNNVVLPMSHALIDEPGEGVRAPAETKGQRGPLVKSVGKGAGGAHVKAHKPRGLLIDCDMHICISQVNGATPGLRPHKTGHLWGAWQRDVWCCRQMPIGDPEVRD